MTLDEIKKGNKAVVISISGEKALKRRIMDMGITKNTLVSIKKLAPLGDPIQISVRGYSLSLRKADAKLIEVK